MLSTTETASIHSPLGKALLTALLHVCYLVPMGAASSILFTGLHSGIATALQLLVVVVPALVVTLALLVPFLRRASVSVYADAEGLKLGKAPAAHIRWSAVHGIKDFTPLGGVLVPLCRVTFLDGKPSLWFYARPGGIEKLQALKTIEQHTIQSV